MENKTIQMETFTNAEFGNVRAIMDEGKPFFCLADVCKCLSIASTSTCKSRLKQDGVVSVEVIDRMGRKQPNSFINESNLYRLILTSRKEEAVKFQDWICDDVLPTIRNTGKYVVPGRTSDIAVPKTLAESLRLNAQLMIQAANAEEEKEKALRVAAEKTEMADIGEAYATLNNPVTITEFAKMLPPSVGRNYLFKILNRWGFIYKPEGNSWHAYSHKTCNNGDGWFIMTASTFTYPDGGQGQSLTLKITEKGIRGVIRRLKAEGLIKDPNFKIEQATA